MRCGSGAVTFEKFMAKIAFKIWLTSKSRMAVVLMTPRPYAAILLLLLIDCNILMKFIVD